MLETETVAPAAVRRASVRRFYAYQLATEAQFFSAVWIIFLRDRGYSLTEIGLSESAFHLAPILLEIPSGAFADIAGRRWSLAIGALLIASSSALLWAAPSLPLVMLALFLLGASYSFRSGANQAYLYEALGDAQGQYAGIFGRLLGAGYAVAAATAWLGAAFSDIDYGFTFGLTIGTALAALWLAVGLYEPPRTHGRQHGEVQRPRLGTVARRHLREAREVLSARPVVTAMLVFSGPFWAASSIAHMYLQAAFSDRGLSNNAVGLVVGAALIVVAIGAMGGGWVERHGGFTQQVAILAAITGAGLAGAALGNTGLAVAAYLAANVASGAIEPVLSNWFNRQFPSEQRATLLSIESWMFSITMIVAFPAAGWLAEWAGWWALFTGAGAVSIVLALLVAAGAKRLQAQGA